MAHQCPPTERGRVGIFNRSYYEEVLVVRVHRELLERQKLPDEVVDKNIWQRRFQSINALEQHLARNGTRIVKFHLRISKEEQRKRFLDRLDEPGKRWKFSMDDIKERALWDKYMDAYEDMIRATPICGGGSVRRKMRVPADSAAIGEAVVQSTHGFTPDAKRRRSPISLH